MAREDICTSRNQQTNVVVRRKERNRVIKKLQRDYDAKYKD